MPHDQSRPALSIPRPTRRAFLAGTVAAVATVAGPTLAASPSTPGTRVFALRPAPGRATLVPGAGRDTAVWCYDGSVPGPEIRVKRGERVRVDVENGLDEETTVHWHGLRVPNAMDGVPHLTQRPIAPGERFRYEFDAHDAGTFWYHPHQRGFEQIARGLYGPLIVEEDEPLRVDREMTWVLDDWRLTREVALAEGFGGMHDASHAGRLGNTVTINGKVPDRWRVRAGERVRLRLVNAANARIFALDFTDHEPVIVALDGQPIAPHVPDGGLVTLGPAMRADVVLDMRARPGSRASVIDRFDDRRAYRLVDLSYADEPLRASTLDWPLDLPANPLPEPDTATAERHEIAFEGGMMGAMMADRMGRGAGERSEGQSGRRGMMGGRSMTGMMHSGEVWTINGVAAEGHVMEPMLTLKKGRTHVLAMTNVTAFHHPIHLHGHSFRVVSRDGRPTRHREWQDTVLMAPTERVEIAFVADNPGDWMFHCHVMEHQAAGMMGVVRVA